MGSRDPALPVRSCLTASPRPIALSPWVPAPEVQGALSTWHGQAGTVRACSRALLRAGQGARVPSPHVPFQGRPMGTRGPSSDVGACGDWAQGFAAGDPVWFRPGSWQLLQALYQEPGSRGGTF